MALRLAVIALLAAQAASLTLRADQQDAKLLNPASLIQKNQDLSGTNVEGTTASARDRFAELEREVGTDVASRLTAFDQLAATDAMIQHGHFPTPEEALRAEQAQPALKGCMHDG